MTNTLTQTLTYETRGSGLQPSGPGASPAQCKGNTMNTTDTIRAVWRSMDQGDQMATIAFAFTLPLILLALLAVIPN